MKKFLILLVIVILVGAAAFFGGMKYGQAKSGKQSAGSQNFQNMSADQRRQLFAAGTAGNFRNGQNSGGFVSGEIVAKDDKSMTVKMPDGSSKIVFFSKSTDIAKSVSGAAGDLEIGKNVTASGTANQDGSLTARTIQLRTALPPASQ